MKIEELSGIQGPLIIVTSEASLESGMARRLINGECRIFNIADPNNEIIFTHKMFVDDDSMGS